MGLDGLDDILSKGGMYIYNVKVRMIFEVTRKIVTSESDRSMGLILFHSRTTQLEKMVPVRYTTTLVLEMMELQGPGLLTSPSVAMVDVVMMIQLGLHFQKDFR